VKQFIINVSNGIAYINSDQHKETSWSIQWDIDHK